MTVFVFTPTYPNAANPVANIFVKEQATKLSRLGHKVVVLAPEQQPTKKLLVPAGRGIRYRRDGKTDVVSVKQKTFWVAGLPLLNQKAFDRSFRKLYAAAMKKFGRPDVIYAHFFNAAYSAVKLGSCAPIVTLEHNGNVMKERLKPSEKRMLKKAVEGSDAFMATSDALRDAIIRHTRTDKNIRVVPNLVDDIFTFKAPTEKECFSFFSLCRFTYDKRVDLLIEAFCDAFGADDNVTLKIGGSGREFENIKSLIVSKKRGHQITLLGMLDRNASLEQYADCDCFVLPSRHETFGLVWREAMCVGRPVITTDHGGFSEKDFNESFGKMVPVDDRDALSDALKKVRENYKNYDLQKISHDNLAMYSSDRIMERIEKILTDSVTDL